MQDDPRTTLPYWRDLAVASITGSKVTPGMLDRTAEIARDSYLAGEACGVWHAAHVALGALERCQCVRCFTARINARKGTEAA